MDKYLAGFQARLQEETEDVYKAQVENYTEFVKSLITTNKILTRHFYIVVPFSGRENDFDVVTEQLNLNVDIVSKGLTRMGMQSRKLTSLEILDLFYSFYSPAQAKRQPLSQQTMQLLTKVYL